MLIAGSTGNGKSTFFKQVVRSLLESSPYIQVYAIDLKGGLEMVDFKPCPNVKVIKTIDHAVSTLWHIKEEMDKRFTYLEKANLKIIDPERDRKDRLLLCIDEASVLYMKTYSRDPKGAQMQEARALTDAIAKLSRAAKINLILATQKLTAEVLPTSITANISGRMCFRTESLQGSLLVLNTRDALDLPEIRGRGVWSYGSKQTIVQSPIVGDAEIKKYSRQVASEFNNGIRKNLQPFLGASQSKASQRNQMILTQSKDTKPKDGA